MTAGLVRMYGQRHLHFITCSCYHRQQLFRTSAARNIFLKTLEEVRLSLRFAVIGYVVMPEHIHLLIGEPVAANPSQVMQVLKQRVAKRFVREDGKPFWQKRFYDFNVWARMKERQKLNYMHWNPVTRRLVNDPGDWPWSSCRWYENGEPGVVTLNEWFAVPERSSTQQRTGA